MLDDYHTSIFIENYWNSGSVRLQERYFDNIVVSTEPIGPYESGHTRGLAPEKRVCGGAYAVAAGPRAFWVHGTGVSAALHAANGRVVARYVAASEGALWDIGHVPAGAYVLELHSTTGTQTMCAVLH